MITLNEIISKCENGIDKFEIYINSILTLNIENLCKGELIDIFNDKYIVEFYNIQPTRDGTFMEIFLKEVLE